ncbi:MAG: baseplate J/gp47 family protein [Oscillospiraceae bacterium]|jgi:uncharacterized phage protein gp47/JayE|nr:baseplate J/gp47 family protein [Oscillospiraceae bacterium]
MNEFEFDAILKSMKDKYFEISGVRVTEASDVGIRFRVIASMLFEVTKKLEESRKEMCLQTAGGKYLDALGKVFGLARMGQKAKGKLRFFGAKGAIEKVKVLAGTPVMAEGQEMLRVVTTEEREFGEGELTLDVEAKAEACGEEYNLAFGKLNTLCSEIDGVVGVTNVEAFEGGRTKEDDESFRKRLVDRVKEGIKATAKEVETDV